MDPAIESEELQYSVEKLQKTNSMLIQQYLACCKETSSLKEENAALRTELETIRDQLEVEIETVKKEREEREVEKEELTQQLEVMSMKKKESDRVITILKESSQKAISDEKKKSEDLKKQLDSMVEKDAMIENQLSFLKAQTLELTKKMETQTRDYDLNRQEMTSQIMDMQRQLTASNALKETNSKLAQQNVRLEKELKETIADDGGRKLCGTTETYELMDLRRTRDKLLKEIALLRMHNQGEYTTDRTSPLEGINVFFTVLEAAMLGKPLHELPEAATKCFECGMSYSVSSEMVRGQCMYCQMLCKAIRLEKEAKVRETALSEKWKETVRQCMKENQTKVLMRDAIIAGLVLLFAIMIAIHLNTE